MFSNADFLAGLESGLVAYNPDASNQYLPQLVLNDFASGRNTLEFVLENLAACKSFTLCVAFVTRSGVACLHQSLKDFGERGGEGEIMVSTYLNFSDPNAIGALRRFKGIEVRFVSEPNFHGKTYLFEHQDFAQLLIGSSNLTQNALGKNTEVNLGLSVQRSSTLYQQTAGQLATWSDRSEIVDDTSLTAYESIWHADRARSGIARITAASADPLSDGEDNYLPSDTAISSPNAMQLPALERLRQVRECGRVRSLIVSATGTGKTVLSAFDVKQFQAKRLLFVVHRLTIAQKALTEFKRVFGESKTMGIYSGSARFDKDAEFIFSTVQTINSDRHLQNFRPDEFDYIIIDETHRAGANTYSRVLSYFTPKFLLGMTATPERTDGFDIFALFDHSIAYEIRLQKAMESDLLAPFHYYGISDLSVDGVALDDKSDFNKLVSDRRINHILENLKEYGCDSGITRGLIFCSRIEEALKLSAAFNTYGLKTVAITGADSNEARETAMQCLEADGDSRLDYILTVDVFNEGVDIPRVNQIVMLRPTASAIIFVQQLGRGLRKAPGKDYVTVIDFIGNYQNNYLIPMALFGDASNNKDSLRRLLAAGSSLIPGASTISFEKVAKERVFASIDAAKLNTKKSLTEDFNLLKFRLGRNPLMMDFVLNESRDPYQYVDYSDSLLAFSASIDSKIAVPSIALKLIAYLGKHVCDGVRLEEGVALEMLIEHGPIQIEQLASEIQARAGYIPRPNAITSAVHNLNLMFVTERSNNQNLRVAEVSGFEVINFDVASGLIRKGKTLETCLSDSVAAAYLLDLVKSSNNKFMEDFCLDNFVGGFRRGTKYTRKDVFRILEWDKLPNAQNVGGYIVSGDGTNCPIFVTYHKEESISDTTKYEDRFLNPGHVQYMSKSRRNLSSPDVKAMREQASNKMRMPFFVKKSDDEGLNFYYLGELTAIPDGFVETSMPTQTGTPISVVQMEFLLDRDVDFRLYKYLTDS